VVGKSQMPIVYRIVVLLSELSEQKPWVEYTFAKRPKTPSPLLLPCAAPLGCNQPTKSDALA
jgi:hypothetical protein